MRRIEVNRRGQQMTLMTIIAIVLGITVLIFLIFGFSTGWNNLWQRITGLGGGKVNVDTVRQSCNLACDSQAQYDYCSSKRTVVFEDKKTITGTCNAIAQNNTAKNLVALGDCSISCPGSPDMTLGGDKLAIGPAP